MEISIPFSYDMRVRTAAGDDVSRTYVERYNVTVPEVMAEDSPIFATVSKFDGHNASDASVGIVLRKLGDRFMEPLKREVWSEYDAQFNRTRSWRPITEDVAGAADIVVGFFRKIRSVAESAEIKLKGPPRAETIITSYSRESALEQVRRLADGMRLIDGELHAVVEEPIYRLENGYVTLTQASLQKAQQLFRLDEVAEMLEAAQSETDCWGKLVNKGRPPLPEVILHDASLLDWSEGKSGLRAAAIELRDKVAYWLLDMPVEVMEAYADLRDVFNGREYNVEIDVEGEILPLAVALSDAIRQHSKLHRALAAHFDAAVSLFVKRTGAELVSNDDMAALSAPGL